MKRLFMLLMVMCSLSLLGRADTIEIIGAGAVISGSVIPPSGAVTSFWYSSSELELDYWGAGTDLSTIALPPVDDHFCATCILLTGIMPTSTVTADSTGMLVSGNFTGWASPIAFYGAGFTEPVAVSGLFTEHVAGDYVDSLHWYVHTSDPSPVPEPTSLLLVASGIPFVLKRSRTRISG